MAKILDLNKTVYELVQVYPELVDIMEEFGFEKIVTPGMLNTVGRVMTIPKGAAMRGLDLELVKRELTNRGYTII